MMRLFLIQAARAYVSNFAQRIDAGSYQIGPTSKASPARRGQTLGPSPNAHSAGPGVYPHTGDGVRDEAPIMRTGSV